MTERTILKLEIVEDADFLRDTVYRMSVENIRYFSSIPGPDRILFAFHLRRLADSLEESIPFGRIEFVPDK